MDSNTQVAREQDSLIYVTFFDYCYPGLTAGHYKVTMKQTLSIQPPSPGKDIIKDSFSARNKEFFASGERFRLQPGTVYSVFPPENHEGFLENRLPHIVFTKKTFPWMREMSSERNQKPGAIRVPWLCLLLFDEDDPIPELQTLTIADLRKEKLQPGVHFNYKKECGETDNDPVQIIDVPKKLFEAIRPNREEMKLLTHVRKVEIFKKEAKPQYPLLAVLDAAKRAQLSLDAEREFAVIIGNRLPRPDRYSVVHLVSLENVDEALVGAGSDDLVRLVSLKSWQFRSCSEKRDMADLAVKLNDKFTSPSTLQFPVVKKENKLHNVLEAGYVAFDHQMRQGTKTVSWYRGPFIPFDVPPGIKTPADDGDQLIGYNPDNGMFDISYAASWRLGRLLALEEKDFAAGIYCWKRKNRQSVITAVEKEALEGIFGPGDPNELLKKGLESLIDSGRKDE
jgi:hypothetical protein